MSPISEALEMIAQYRAQHGAAPEVMHVSFRQWQAMMADRDACTYIVKCHDGIDQLAGVKIEVQPEPPTFKRPTDLE